MSRTHNQARNTRRVFQALFLLLFLYLFAGTVFPAAGRIPFDLFLRADTLLAISTALSLRKITLALALFALPVLLLTLIFGRVFCGWMCPLGATLDLSEKVFRWKRSRQLRNQPQRFPALRRLKYYLLAGLLVMAAIPGGLSLVYLFDPIATLTRSLTLAIVAPLQSLLVLFHADQALVRLAWSDFITNHQTLANLLAGAQKGLGVFVDAPGARPEPLFYRFAPLALLIFGGIIALNSLTRRFWCRYLCPLGALLGVLSRWSPVKKRVSEACNDCGRCVRSCRMAAISEDPHVYRAGECVACHECISICPTGAICYLPAKANLKSEPPADLSRRRLLQAAGIGAVAVLALKSDWGAKKVLSGRQKVSAIGLIRPPGSLAEEKFVAACVRCGECMKVCPTNGLQPALGEGGLEAFWTPILVPRIGPCALACNACGKVCPTGAIEPCTIEEKSWLYLGTAVIDHNMCIAWSSNKVCSICDEACSYNAIDQKDPKLPPGTRPVVNEKKCVGCGLCEKSCPLQPLAAIRVFSFGDKRHLSRAEQHALFLTEQKKSPEG